MTPDQSDKHQQNFKQLLTDLGEDPARDGLLKTPSRYVNSLKDLTSGYQADIPKIMNDALFDVTYKDMVVVRDIEIYSLCEHHIIPFYGRAHVGYIPNGKVIGLSKIPRLVEAFARRLQVQERLTHDISTALQEYLDADGVGVIVEAYHFCMMMRGIRKQNSFTITSSMLGQFQKLETRNEFMAHVRAHGPQC